jgi:opacity protein-like surface antigen
VKKLLVFAVLTLISFTCYANKLDIYLMGGPSFSKISNNRYVQINQYEINQYNTSSTSHTQPLFGLGIAHSFDNFTIPFRLSLGVSAYYTSFGTTNGTEYPFANDGIFDSLNYQFDSKSITAMLETHLTYASYSWQPYGILGVGVAWNHLSGYSETPTVPTESAASSLYPFNNHTKTSFAYELGLGVEKEIYKDNDHHIQYFLSLEYRYMNLGKGELGTQSLPHSNDGLQVSNLQKQLILFALKASF